MKLYRAEASNIVATDGTLTSAALAVTPTVGAASKLVLGAATLTPAAGAADNLTLTRPGHLRQHRHHLHRLPQHHLLGRPASPGGNAPTVANCFGHRDRLRLGHRAHLHRRRRQRGRSANGVMKLYRAEASNILATDGTLTSAALAVTPTVGAASKLVLGAATLTPAAGAADNLTLTVQDTYGNTVTTYTGSHNITFSGASASPGGNAPTVANAAGTATAFGSATALTFTAGVASVAGSANGVMKLYRAGAVSLTATDGTVSTATALSLTVAATAAAKLALTGVTASAGSAGVGLLLHRSVTGLGNSGTIKRGRGHRHLRQRHLQPRHRPLGLGNRRARRTISGGALTIASSGAAESSTQFTFTAPSSGNYTPRHSRDLRRNALHEPTRDARPAEVWGTGRPPASCRQLSEPDPSRRQARTPKELARRSRPPTPAAAAMDGLDEHRS